MDLENLLGCRVRILVSDPWDFGTEVGSSPFFGTVQRTSGRDLLILLDKPFRYRAAEYGHVVASPRHVGVGFESLLPGGQVSAALIPMSAHDTHMKDPFDLSTWRGGVGLLGLLQRNDTDGTVSRQTPSRVIPKYLQLA